MYPVQKGLLNLKDIVSTLKSVYLEKFQRPTFFFDTRSLEFRKRFIFFYFIFMNVYRQSRDVITVYLVSILLHTVLEPGPVISHLTAEFYESLYSDEGQLCV